MYNEERTMCENGVSTIDRRPYSAEIYENMMKLKEIAINIRDKSKHVSGIPEPEDCLDHKEQESQNYSETIIRELVLLEHILVDINKDLDRFV